jgi:hypothetical protein
MTTRVTLTFEIGGTGDAPTAANLASHLDEALSDEYFDTREDWYIVGIHFDQPTIPMGVCMICKVSPVPDGVHACEVCE